MKKTLMTTLLAACFLFFATQIFAASGHGTHGDASHKGHSMDKAGHGDHDTGMKIHASTRDGYTFEYRLINMKEKMAQMKNMPEMTDTHHLMVFVKDPGGSVVKTAKVGYLIRANGSGDVQKKMAMAMNDGFGADVTLGSGEHYTIKTKVMAGGKSLIDEFTYMGGDH